MGVGILREMLHEAAIRFAIDRDPDSARFLEEIAEKFGIEKKRSRVRREKWRERKEARIVGDGFMICRVEGCRESPQWRPVLSFPPLDGGTDRILVDTVMLDVCEAHARSLGPDAYTDNPDVWGALCKVWTDQGLPSPDPSLAMVEYVRIPDHNPSRVA